MPPDIYLCVPICLHCVLLEPEYRLQLKTLSSRCILCGCLTGAIIYFLFLYFPTSLPEHGRDVYLEGCRLIIVTGEAGAVS